VIAVRSDRLARLARVLCMGPTPRPFDLRGSASEGWWLTGGLGGDVKLPRTRGCSSEADALDAAEGWLAPELDVARGAILALTLRDR